MIRTAVVTISDKGSRGERIDETGPAISELIKKNGYCVEYYNMIPDEMEVIQEELVKLCDENQVNLILTNGGTGFAKRDVTPEATMEVIDKHVPGIGEAMRMKSLAITPRAMLSRATAGIRKNTLIVNLPGSPRAAVENLEFIIDGLQHGIEILLGEAKECARKE